MELFRALGVLAEPPADGHEAVADVLGLPASATAEEYTECFLFQLYPYASVYVGNEGMMGGEARARIGGFWSALGFSPPAEPDHVSALFGLYAALSDRESTEDDADVRAAWRKSRFALLWEHLACWIIPYLQRMEELAPPTYAAWAGLARQAVVRELRIDLRPTALPVHLATSEPLRFGDMGQPPDGGDIVRGLLAPVRSGIILTRADLIRAARELELGLRIGERAFVLRSLFSQEPFRTAEWLIGEAESWKTRHEAMTDDLGVVASFWAERAQETAAMLETEELSHVGY